METTSNGAAVFICSIKSNRESYDYLKDGQNVVSYGLWTSSLDT